MPAARTRAWSCSEVNPHKNSNYANTKLTMAQKIMCNSRTERNLFRSCMAERLQNSARQIVGKVGLWHEKHAKRPKKSMDFTRKEPVQLDEDLRCNDLSRRLQLYRQIAGTVVLQHAATCTARRSRCQLPAMTIVGSALNLHELYRYTRVGTLIVATIYLQLIQNRYMFRSFTVLQCSHQHCVQPLASDVEVVGYL